MYHSKILYVPWHKNIGYDWEHSQIEKERTFLMIPNDWEVRAFKVEQEYTIVKASK